LTPPEINDRGACDRLHAAVLPEPVSACSKLEVAKAGAAVDDQLAANLVNLTDRNRMEMPRASPNSV
jgi:hypothetical protein